MHARQSGTDRRGDLGALCSRSRRAMPPQLRPRQFTWKTSSMASARNFTEAQGRAEIFSRDLRRMTDQFSELAEQARKFEDELILDGEIMAFEQGRKLTFFDLQKRLGRKSEGPDLFATRLGGRAGRLCCLRFALEKWDVVLETAAAGTARTSARPETPAAVSGRGDLSGPFRGRNRKGLPALAPPPS